MGLSSEYEETACKLYWFSLMAIGYIECECRPVCKECLFSHLIFIIYYWWSMIIHLLIDDRLLMCTSTYIMRLKFEDKLKEAAPVCKECLFCHLVSSVIIHFPIWMIDCWLLQLVLQFLLWTRLTWRVNQHVKKNPQKWLSTLKSGCWKQLWLSNVFFFTISMQKKRDCTSKLIQDAKKDIWYPQTVLLWDHFWPD